MDIDDRSEERKRLDEQIASEPHHPIPEIDPSTPGRPLEYFMAKLRAKPFAVYGVVENGLVRPIDPNVELPERAHVVIVGSER